MKEPKNNYFTEQLQNIIIKYNNSNNQEQRQYLYNNYIHEAFKTIAQSLISKYNIEEKIDNAYMIRQQCISEMVKKMGKYDKKRGKAFTYFTVIARNFILSYLNRYIKSNKKYTSINQLNYQNKEINLIDEYSTKLYEQKEQAQYSYNIVVETIQIFKQLIKKQYMPNIKNNRREMIVNGILRLIDDVEQLNNFNRKAIYVYLKQYTGEKNLRLINKILKDLSNYYYKAKQQVVSEHYYNDKYGE